MNWRTVLFGWLSRSKKYEIHTDKSEREREHLRRQMADDSHRLRQLETEIELRGRHNEPT